MKLFRVRDKETGWYQVRGDSPKWAVHGHLWTEGQLRTHITRMINGPYKISPKWEVIEYEVVESKVTTLDTWVRPELIVKLLGKKHD